MPTTYTTPGATRSPRRRSRRRQSSFYSGLLKGLLAAIGVTLVCVLLFALLMQWLKPADGVIRVVNQLIKLGAIFAGVRVMFRCSNASSILSGALLGLVYMALGVGLYALLSGQQLPILAYLSDIAMGVAGGGICGALVQALRK